MKNFTDDDISAFDTLYPRIFVDRSELIVDQPEWMQMGLTQTASGYGKKLNSGFKISFNGKLYRLYITIFSNNGSMWFTVKGTKIYVD